MYGLYCDMCGRFSKTEDADGWGKIQALTTSYDNSLCVTGEAKHVCPTCLAIMTEKFIN